MFEIIIIKFKFNGKYRSKTFHFFEIIFGKMHDSYRHYDIMKQISRSCDCWWTELANETSLWHAFCAFQDQDRVNIWNDYRVGLGDRENEAEKWNYHAVNRVTREKLTCLTSERWQTNIKHSDCSNWHQKGDREILKIQKRIRNKSNRISADLVTQERRRRRRSCIWPRLFGLVEVCSYESAMIFSWEWFLDLFIPVGLWFLVVSFGFWVLGFV